MKLVSRFDQSIALPESYAMKLKNQIVALYMVSSFLLLIALLASSIGCVESDRLVRLPDQPPEIPASNLPLPLRQKNWVDARGSGSCVIASTVYHFRWMGQPQIADYFRKTYAGGQTDTSIRKFWRAAKIPYACTGDIQNDKDADMAYGDPEFLEWASRTRRGAIIWYFDSHCVTFCGFSKIDRQEFALLCDNNRVEKFIRIPKRQFLTNWRGYGGFACTALLPPAPRLPFEGYQLVAN